MTFAFNAPLTVTVPAGGWLVIELVMEGNSLNGGAHAFLDAIQVGGGPVDGSVVLSGTGCAATTGGMPMTAAVSGVSAPGAAHFVTGANLRPNAPAFVILGLDDTTSPFGALPFQLPGTTCSLLVRPDVYTLVIADAAGELEASASTALAVPADPAFAGLVIHEQLLGLATGANTAGFALSNKVSVTLGTFAAPNSEVYMVSHGTDANAAIADEVAPLGYAMRLVTQ